MSYEIREMPRDEDGFALWTSDASRAIKRGEFIGAIAILVESGHEPEEAERYVAVQLAVSEERIPKLDRRHEQLAELVVRARRVMSHSGWTLADVALELEHAQKERAR